jgi:N-acetylglucosamine-6-phosphate deacetylase
MTTSAPSHRDPLSAGGSATLPPRPGESFAVRGQLVLGTELVPGGVVVRDGRIVDTLRDLAGAALPETVLDAHVVSPGFIDLQVNGAFGLEVGKDAEAVGHLASRLPSTGVTAFLPTLVSSAAAVYPKTCEAFLASRNAAGARPLGLHLEGPFLSPHRPGAHRLEAIRNARADVFDVFLRNDVLRLVTLAPEIAGGRDRIRFLRSHGVLVSLGHTDATYEEFAEGVDAGARMGTHLFNAMSPFRHRAPGSVGAALLDDRLTVGIIPDGVHCHHAALRLAVKAKGADRVCLVTDAIAGAGMPPGMYQLDGQDVQVTDTLAQLEDGTLAGSILTFDQGVRNVVKWGYSVADACRMSSEVPAKLLGLSSKGSLSPGFDADLVLLDPELRVLSTFVEGRRFF